MLMYLTFYCGNSHLGKISHKMYIVNFCLLSKYSRRPHEPKKKKRLKPENVRNCPGLVPTSYPHLSPSPSPAGETNECSTATFFHEK